MITSHTGPPQVISAAPPRSTSSRDRAPRRDARRRGEIAGERRSASTGASRCRRRRSGGRSRSSCTARVSRGRGRVRASCSSPTDIATRTCTTARSSPNAAWALTRTSRERRLRALMRPSARAADQRGFMTMLADREDRDARDVTRHLGGIVGSGWHRHSVVVAARGRAACCSASARSGVRRPFVRVAWDGRAVGAWDSAASIATRASA